jgi:hypothetical protein
MAAFLYRCPNRRLNVQGRVADDPTDLSEDTFEAVTCMACLHQGASRQSETGKVLGTDED